MQKSYQKVSEYIWEKVSSGELRAGDRLPPEREMAELLGISRNSVREGLKTLENIGVVSSQHGAGNFVSAQFEDTMREILSFMFILKGMNDSQITEFRCAMEWEAVKLITGKVSGETREKLLKHLERLENAETEAERVKQDKAIHYVIIEAAGNDYMNANYHALTRVIDIYIPKLRSKIITGMQGDVKLRSAHRMIVEGILEGDLEKALKGLELHFQYIREYQDM